MQQRNNTRRPWAVLGVAILAIGGLSFTEAKGGVIPDDPVVRKDILSEVQALYGITADQAIQRLAAEQAAAALHWRIRHMELKGYAGSWFDQIAWKLNVAISGAADTALIKRLGATPVTVARSLAALRGLRKHVESLLGGDPVTAKALRATWIDYRLNKIVVGVAPERVAATSTALAARNLGSDAVKVVASGRFSFSSDLHGADGMCNYWYPDQTPKCERFRIQCDTENHPCSIGASVVGGFVTAGHCGETGDRVSFDDHGNPSLLGTVMGSTMTTVSLPGGGFTYSFANNEDGAWVDVDAGWTPQARINNYGPGSIPVSAQWAGMLEAPVGATVCRYGKTTSPDNDGIPGNGDPVPFDGVEGADCGTVNAMNVTFSMDDSDDVHGMTMVKGACSEGGDSGGPFVTPAGQVQGTLSGHKKHGDCPVDEPVGNESHGQEDYVVFQPIQTTLSRFQPNGHPLIMLTTHGAAKPTIHGAGCITGVLGIPNHFVCSFDDYESQGETTLLWSASSSSPSSWPDYSRFCTPGQWVYVDLAMTNPYGTAHAYINFQCP